MRAMELGLEELVLGDVEMLDMEALIEYSRHVKCCLEIDWEIVN